MEIEQVQLLSETREKKIIGSSNYLSSLEKDSTKDTNKPTTMAPMRERGVT